MLTYFFLELLVHAELLERFVEIASELISKGGGLQRKSIMKLCGRIGLTFLKPKVNQSWHYQQRTKSLLENEPKQSSNLIIQEDNEELDEKTSEIIEQIVGIILQGIKDVDTKVRWSSARRLSYLSARLQKSFSDQLIECILELFSPLEEDGAWHG